MKKEAAHFHARVSFQGIPQIAIFPAGKALKEEHLEFLFPDRNRGGDRVVLRIELVRCFRKRQGKLVVTSFAWSPEKRVANATHRGNGDLATERFGFRSLDRDRGGVILGEGAVQGEGKSDRLSTDSKCWCVESGDDKVGKAVFASDRNGEYRDFRHSESGRGRGWWLPGIPVAIREQNDAAQIRLLLDDVGEGISDVGSFVRFR